MSPRASLIVFAAAVALLPATAAAAPFTIGELRCELRANPLGVESAKPRLSWVLASTRRGARQAAYQILVSRDAAAVSAGRGDLWDSGKIASTDTIHVAYAGAALGSGERAFWRVRVWDDRGAVVTSPVAFWQMGLLSRDRWQAKFIGLPAPQRDAPVPFDEAPVRWIKFPGDGRSNEQMAVERFYRRRFTLPAGAVRRAHVTMSAADQFILRINGETAGGARDWKQLQLIDVTALLRAGENVITVQQRRKTEPGALLGQLRVEVASGQTVTLSTDRAWRTSAVRHKEWLANDFDDRGWVAAQELAPMRQGPFAALTPAAIRPQAITPPAYLRRAFALDRPVRRATLHATALGIYELSLNGRRVGDFHHAPGWTDYGKRLLYQSYDVTALLARGPNVIGGIVAEGWYAGRIGWFPSNHASYGPEPQKLLAQLEVEHADGTRTVVATDDAWKASFGAITTADLMDGESHDARKELPGWNRAGFDDASWTAAVVYDREARTLTADPGPPIRAVEELRPRAVTSPRPGVWIYDLGQNMTGWVRLRARAAAGTTARLRFAEILDRDGGLYTENLRSIKVADSYTFKGAGVEVWEPRFTLHGFRYVELTGLPGRPPKDAVTGVVVHSDTPLTGTLVTSSALVNQLQKNIVWGQRGNFISVPTDCPQRDERLGWTGDAQIFVGTACYNADVATFFTKWMNDVVDAQSPAGAFPDVAPRLGDFNDGSPAWGDAGVIVPWTMYRCYGDRRLLETHYPAMQRWVAYVRDGNPDGLWARRTANNYGDWVSIDANTDKDVLATAYHALSARLVGKTAAALGKTADAASYEALFEKVRAAFVRAYVTPDGKIKSDTQTAYLLALRFDLLPAALRPRAVEHLVAALARREYRLSTGFLGVGHLLPGLAENGRLDLAYQLLNNDTFPSWGYSIKHGATTIWERWDGWTHDKGFQTPAMNSFNHYAFGSVGEWMFRTIAGIDADTPGYGTAVIRPQPGGGLTHARATYRSIRGPITTDWRVDKGVFHLRVELPMNMDAVVHLPGGEQRRVGSGRHVFTAAVGG